MTSMKTRFLEDTSKYTGLAIKLREDGEVHEGTISSIKVNDGFIEFYIEGNDRVFCGVAEDYFTPFQDEKGAIHFDIIYIGSVKIY